MGLTEDDADEDDADDDDDDDDDISIINGTPCRSLDAKYPHGIISWSNHMFLCAS